MSTPYVEQATSSLGQVPGAVYQILHCRLEVMALGAVAHRCVMAEQAVPGHRHDPFKVEVVLAGPVPRTSAQLQFLAKAVAAETGRQRTLTVAATASESAAHTFLGRGTGANRERGNVQRQPFAGQHSVGGRLAARQGLDHRRFAVRKIGRTRIHALAERGAREQQADSLRPASERIAGEVLDGRRSRIRTIPAGPESYAESRYSRRRRCQAARHRGARAQVAGHGGGAQPRRHTSDRREVIVKRLCRQPARLP